MDPTAKPLLGFLLISLIFSISISTASSSSFSTVSDPPDAPTVYEILPKFGLPKGLLPNTVTSYSFSEEDGAFSVELQKPCYIKFEYLVYYEKHITGKLSYGSITNLEGIQVQKFFLWLDVNEIRVDLPPSDSIYFQVGLINKQLDINQFKTIHSCRDGVSSSIACALSSGKTLEMVLME